MDGNQIFYQVVLRRDHPLAQGDRVAFYERMLKPVAEAYNDLGVPARYRPVNDVITAEGRKIAGTGAAEIGDWVTTIASQSLMQRERDVSEIAKQGTETGFRVFPFGVGADVDGAGLDGAHRAAVLADGLGHRYDDWLRGQTLVYRRQIHAVQHRRHVQHEHRRVAENQTAALQRGNAQLVHRESG